jgi:hypothetical protein
MLLPRCAAPRLNKRLTADIDTDKLDFNTIKHDDLNLMFAHHKEKGEMYPLTTIEITKAQCKDQELKVYLKKYKKCHKRIHFFNLLRTQKCYVRMVNLSFQHL